MSDCIKCGKKDLSNDEIAVYKKMINRGSTEFMCIDCLAEYYHVSRQAIEDKIEYFKQTGCVLFS